MSLSSRLLPLCCLGLGLGLGLAWFGSHNASDTAAARAPAPVATPLTAPSPAPRVSVPDAPSLPAASRGAEAPAEPDNAQEPAPLISDEARARLYADIDAAYTTYEASALPKLTPHLRHPDPEVRAYARDAIVQLGQTEGAAALRAAAREARDPHEAAELLDAAEFLELPPAPPATAGNFPSVAGQTHATRRAASPSF